MSEVLANLEKKGGGGGIKIYTDSFTIAASSTTTITLSDMNGYDYCTGASKWVNEFPFFHSLITGDLIYRNNAWEPSPSTFLKITVNGNQITITNPITAAATVTGFEVHYY